MLAILILSLVPTAAPAAAVKLPPGFSARRVADGLTGAAAMEVAPDGRIFLCEQTGALRIVKNGALLPRPFVTLKVDSAWERGLIGVTLDPSFSKNHYVYVNAVAREPFPHHQIIRFTAAGDIAVAGSATVLFEGDDQRTLGGEVPAGHQGGAIHFGADGKLYVALGEQTAGTPAQRLDTLLGKLLRLNPDGSVPRDNPFFTIAHGKYRAIWALGLRNPFTFAVQPGTGRIYINDVGGSFEEINEGHAGANYGWPTVDHGPTSDPRFLSPVYHYPVSSITGGAFCPPGVFPREYQGRYFFLDFTLGWVRTIHPDRPGTAQEFASGFLRPVDLKFAPDGSLYVLSRNAWVNDKDFRPGTGALFKVVFDGSRIAPTARAPSAEPPPTPPPSFSPASGIYTGPIRVALHVAEGTLRYSTDGQPPTAASPRYEAPFRIDRSATVLARAFVNGQPTGPLLRASYTIRGSTPYGLPVRAVLRDLNVTTDPAKLPARLSRTGLFESLADLTPRPGIVPYDVNSPLWSDGAVKRRWVALPHGETIGFAKTGEWTFPRGAVFIKHFELPTDEANPQRRKRLETRLLVTDGAGGGYGVTYRWRADGSDADLLTEGAAETVQVNTRAGSWSQTWSYPSRDDCLRCHTTNAGFVLGPKTRQLNRMFTYSETGLTDNQLRTWSYLGMLRPALDEAEIPRLDRLVAIDDTSASVAERARSYLDANCMHCHRPKANIPAAFDARVDTPLAKQNLVGAAPVSDRLGIDRPQIVAPGDPERSLLYLRMIQPERFKMPPLARNVVDRQAAEVIKEWIENLAAKR